MKRFLILLATLFCTIAFADTITINWLNEDKTVLATSSCTIGGDVILPNNIPQKRGYTFKGYVDNYTPVEYIESTGSQWIDTGYKVNSVIGIKAKINIISTSSAQYFGINSSDRSFYLYANSKGILTACERTICNMLSNTPLNSEDVLEINWKKTVLSIYINDVQYNTSFGSILESNNNIQIFRTNVSGVSLMKLYYFQIYKNDVLVRDFIPVVDSKGVACLYDKIEHKFYYNAGSGDFIAGPVVGSGGGN